MFVARVRAGHAQVVAFVILLGAVGGEGSGDDNDDSNDAGDDDGHGDSGGDGDNEREAPTDAGQHLLSEHVMHV